ncbi:glycosyltransferase family 2 protein [Pseudorhodoferax soli]|uniref:Glycosyltransferase involved in cell wall biosynthesis n=1 Tax=Pseudorhodoferax soli TaxID=545864 RepID=A0A368XDP0_9BURK|nr:glycosyltransferase family 2 protein [Pseudorhodoferax soli]RCW66092.1 glycosyltransferase involved in cell wall biosynthesis [Pseudorhodoferax soli]
MNAINRFPFGPNGAGSVQLSVVVPFYNEREVLPLCLRRITGVLFNMGIPTEIVFVDDGSTDEGSEVLSFAAFREPDHDEPRVRVVRLSRNFGKEAAMMAGIEHAKGEAVVVLDADLQDPPELIPAMVHAWYQGADVVSMRHRQRDGETWLKRASAHAYYRILQRLSRSPMPVDTGDFRLLSRRAVQALLQLPERCRYMKGLYAWIGLPTTVITYDRAPRAAGRSTWSYGKLIGLAMEGITSFSVAPLRWVTGFGMLAAIAGGGFGLNIIGKTVLFGSDVHGYPSLIALVTFLGGVQLITVGLLGEYVGKTYIESKQRPLYLVRDILQPSGQPVEKAAWHGANA